MNRKLFIQIGIVIVVTLVSRQSAQAQLDIEPTEIGQVFNQDPEERIWHSFSSWSFKGGNERTIGEVDMFLPLWQDHETLLFADLRGQIDNDSNSEGNWGLGLRKMYDFDRIFGVYAYYDSRLTQFDNSFDQVTLGIELLTVEWEARVNGYLPGDNGKLANSLTTTELSSGGTILIRGGVERAYYGFDAEIGALLASWGECDDIELRGFIGGFHFDNNNANFPNISGPRARLELRLYDLDFLGSGSRIVLAGEIQYDQVRDTTGFGILQVRIPLNLRAASSRSKMSRIERRMVDRIVRDIDVVAVATQAPATPGINPETGAAFGTVTVVDAETVDVPGTVLAAGASSTVVADGSKGQIDVADPIVTSASQVLRGGGFRVLGPNGAEASFGTRPTINGTDGSDDVIGLVSTATVRDLNIKGGDEGIAGAGISGFTINSVSVTGTGGNGIELTGSNSGTIKNSQVKTSGGMGLSVGTWTGGMIASNNISSNMSDNAFFTAVSGGMIMDNRFNSSTSGDGLTITTLSSGTISGNFFLSNMSATSDGFNANTITGGSITGNTATSNGRDGFRLGVTGAGGIAGTTFTGNGSTSNTGMGYNVNDMGGNTFSGNTASGNTGGNALP